MEQKFLPEENIDAVLKSLDGVQRAEATPFFYTRLKARMERENSSKGIAGIVWLRPSMAFATLAIFVILNVVTIINKKNELEKGLEKTTSTVAEQMAKDYDLSISTY
jgi:hypothetical protein